MASESPASYFSNVATSNWLTECIKPRLAYWDNFCSLFSKNEGAFHKAVYPMPKIDDIVAAQPMTAPVNLPMATRYTDENGHVIVADQTLAPPDYMFERPNVYEEIRGEFTREILQNAFDQIPSGYDISNISEPRLEFDSLIYDVTMTIPQPLDHININLSLEVPEDTLVS